MGMNIMVRTRLIQFVTIFFLALLFISIFVAPGSAHPPSNMKLKYDHAANELEIIITHQVSNENDHYIFRIDIWKNGTLYLTLNYTRQPSKGTFSYNVKISADQDDVIKVTAYCNYNGDLTTTLDLAEGTESESDSPELWPFHSLPMLIGFILMVTGIGIAKTMKKKDWWVKAHKTLNAVGSILAIFGLIMAIYMVNEAGSAHFRVPHAVLGGVTISLLILSPILGFALMKGTEKTEKLRPVHRWAGRIAITLMLIVMITGYSLVGVL
jgi:cytochrome bd-type quinol oxidase subunit 1